jgi:hypothetical protein
MSEQESNRIRRIVGWGIIGLIAVIGVSIVLSFYFAPQPLGAFYYPFFFPFQFGWLGGIFLIFIVFWVARWFFWPWRGGGYITHTGLSMEMLNPYSKRGTPREKSQENNSNR